MYPPNVITPETFASRFAQLMPEYLPGVDTGAFEPTDRRRCWNKSLRSVLGVMAEEQHCKVATADTAGLLALRDQLGLVWFRDSVPLLAAATGWGDRKELDLALVGLEAYKSPQKLLLYTCIKWQDAVLDQIRASLQRYPYYAESEQYIFLNLIASENRFHLLVSGEKPGASLRVVSGSPIPWRTRSGTSRA